MDYGSDKTLTQYILNKNMIDQIGAKDVIYGCQHDSFSVNYARFFVFHRSNRQQSRGERTRDKVLTFFVSFRGQS